MSALSSCLLEGMHSVNNHVENCPDEHEDALQEQRDEHEDKARHAVAIVVVVVSGAHLLSFLDSVRLPAVHVAQPRIYLNQSSETKLPTSSSFHPFIDLIFHLRAFMVPLGIRISNQTREFGNFDFNCVEGQIEIPRNSLPYCGPLP